MLRRLRSGEAVPILTAVLVVVTVAVVLRIDRLGQPSYWLDEILGQHLTSEAARQPWWRWLTGFEREHGPLYYLSQLAARAFGNTETIGRLAAAVAGILAVAVLPFALRTREASVRIASLIAAALLAASPMHVYYSREARPYALLMLLAVLLLIVLLRARSAAATGAILVAILYTSAVGAPLVAATAVAALIAVWLSDDSEGRRYFRVTSGFAAVCLGSFLLLYRGTPERGAVAPFPGLDHELLTTALRQLTVSVLAPMGGERTAAAIALLAVAGGIHLVRRDRRAGAIVIVMAIVPLVLSIGALWLFDHWYAARYLSPALPSFLLLAAAGVVAAGRLATRPFQARWPRASRAGAVLLMGVIVVAITAQTWRAARTEPFQKLDWRSIARTIHQYSRPGDVVVTAEDWSDVSLGFYLRQLPPKVRLARAVAVPIAAGLIDESDAAWLVTAGYTDDSSVRDWFCRYPLLLSNEHEEFRLHYAPSEQHFLDHRAGTAEYRALAAALGTSGFTLDMDAGSDLLLRDGWAGPESQGEEAFRWVSASEARVVIPRPRPRDRVIGMRLLPLMHWTLPEQTVTVALNGVVIGRWTLAREWAEYTLGASAALWNEGRNDLTFSFGRVTRPTVIDSDSRDERPLAAAFDWISVQDRDSSTSPAVPVRPFVRIATDVLVRRDAEKDGAAALLRREPALALLGRLGTDPEEAWPRLQRGEVTLDAYAQAVAHGSGCLDDRSFARMAWPAIFGRMPGPDEERAILATLRSGVDRRRFVRRMLSSDELRRAVLAD